MFTDSFGNNASYSNWYSNQPDGTGNCIRMWDYPSDKLDDIGCTDDFGYPACQYGMEILSVDTK